MIEFYTFENDLLERKKELDNLKSLSEVSVINIKIPNSELGIYVVPREFEMRLDLISNYLYGNTKYVEELMKLNSIINPFSIKQGDIINYVNVDRIVDMHSRKEDRELEQYNLELVDKNKNNKNKSEPVKKPSNIKQVNIDDKNKKLKIINSFKR